MGKFSRTSVCAGSKTSKIEMFIYLASFVPGKYFEFIFW